MAKTAVYLQIYSKVSHRLPSLCKFYIDSQKIRQLNGLPQFYGCFAILQIRNVACADSADFTYVFLGVSHFLSLPFYDFTKCICVKNLHGSPSIAVRLYEWFRGINIAVRLYSYVSIINIVVRLCQCYSKLVLPAPSSTSNTTLQPQFR